MVYECECGCKMNSDSPAAVEKHEQTIKNLVLAKGGTMEDFKTIRACHMDVVRWRKAGKTKDYSPAAHDRYVLQVSSEHFGWPPQFLDPQLSLKKYSDNKFNKA